MLNRGGVTDTAFSTDGGSDGEEDLENLIDEVLARREEVAQKEQEEFIAFHTVCLGVKLSLEVRTRDAPRAALLPRRRRLLTPLLSSLCRATPRASATFRSPTCGRRRGGRSCRRPSGAPSCGRSSSRRRSSAGARPRSPTSSERRSTRSPRRSRRSGMGSRTWRRTSRRRRCGRRSRLSACRCRSDGRGGRR